MAEALLEQQQLRPPESEVYGRSLSSIHRLGAFMVDKALPETIASPEADQARIEFYTSVEEGFGTDRELGGRLEVRDFDYRPIINGRVMSKDLKTAVSSMTEAGLRCAEKTALEDRRFLPQLVRSKWDHDNAQLVDRMARGETDYNTRIVVSPFPEEAAAQSGDDYWRNIGYVPHLKRGFVQLYFASEKGLVSGSLSFDGANKHQLRAIFSRLGIEIPAGESTDNWLKYAITGNFSEAEARQLAMAIADEATSTEHVKDTNTVDITRRNRAIMERVFNDSYIHLCESLFRGYQTEAARQLIYQFANQAHHFNRRYAQALYAMRANAERFTADDSIILHELLVYSTIEMMRALHLDQPNQHHSLTGLNYGYAIDRQSFQAMIGGYGAEGARHNRTYSACGLAISLGGESPTDESGQNPQSAFGGVDSANDKEDWSWKPGVCRIYNCPTRPGKTKVGPCHVCVGCQHIFDGGKDPIEVYKRRLANAQYN